MDFVHPKGTIPFGQSMVPFDPKAGPGFWGGARKLGGFALKRGLPALFAAYGAYDIMRLLGWMGGEGKEDLGRMDALQSMMGMLAEGAGEETGAQITNRTLGLGAGLMEGFQDLGGYAGAKQQGELAEIMMNHQGAEALMQHGMSRPSYAEVLAQMRMM
jgi:hypothetical protein